MTTNFPDTSFPLLFCCGGGKKSEIFESRGRREEGATMGKFLLFGRVGNLGFSSFTDAHRTVANAMLLVKMDNNTYCIILENLFLKHLIFPLNTFPIEWDRVFSFSLVFFNRPLLISLPLPPRPSGNPKQPPSHKITGPVGWEILLRPFKRAGLDCLEV